MGFAFESQEKAGSTLQCFALGGPKLLDAGFLTTDFPDSRPYLDPGCLTSFFLMDIPYKSEGQNPQK